MDKARLNDLYQKYLEQRLSPDELAEFKNAVVQPENEATLIELLDDRWDNLQDDILQYLPQGADERLFLQLREPRLRRLWPRIAAAASIIFVLFFGGYFILHRQKTVQQTAALTKNDVAPGHQQATLTLANGQKIILKKGLSGQLVKQNQTTINASQNDIVYNSNGSSTDQEVYNTLNTAIGEQSPYPLVLSDGTKVWLNAASSITFPVAFKGKERLVKITGEAYFEVVHNDRQPFRVQSATQTVEDIGTHFDINAYTDEPVVRTTLVEGSVRVNANSHAIDRNNNIKLEPGQQSQLVADEFRVQSVNAARAIAWKDGNFRFQNDDIQTIMRQLARWYNIEVHYLGSPPVDKFSGRISRRNPISAVLHMMELTNHVHFKIEERRITIIR